MGLQNYATSSGCLRHQFRITTPPVPDDYATSSGWLRHKFRMTTLPVPETYNVSPPPSRKAGSGMGKCVVILLLILYLYCIYILKLIKTFTKKEKYIYIVVFTTKRSQAEVFTVYFSLNYLECNNYNIHSALGPLAWVNAPSILYTLHWVKSMSADVYLYSDYAGQPEVSSPYWSLNTALLASQPYTRRFRISRLAPVLKKNTQVLYQVWEP